MPLPMYADGFKVRTHTHTHTHTYIHTHTELPWICYNARVLPRGSCVCVCVCVQLLPDTCYLSQPAANIPTKLAWQTTNRVSDTSLLAHAHTSHSKELTHAHTRTHTAHTDTHAAHTDTHTAHTDT